MNIWKSHWEFDIVGNKKQILKYSIFLKMQDCNNGSLRFFLSHNMTKVVILKIGST